MPRDEGGEVSRGQVDGVQDADVREFAACAEAVDRRGADAKAARDLSATPSLISSYSAHDAPGMTQSIENKAAGSHARVAEGEIVEIVGAIVKPACGASRSGPASPSRREKVDLSSGT